MFHRSSARMLLTAVCWCITACSLQGNELCDAHYQPGLFLCDPEAAELVCHEGGCCQTPRMTLFQWSYGTSFSGGAPLDENLVADRPDFTEASTTVGRGVVQLEYGYTYFRDNNGSSSLTLHSIGETLLRIGLLAEWLELRLATTYFNESVDIGSQRMQANGISDLYLGVKIALTPQEGLLPEMAIVPQMFVPVGDPPFHANQVLPGVNWIYAWDLTDRWYAAGQTLFNRAIDPESLEDCTIFSQSAVTGYSLTERLTTYVECFGLFPMQADSLKPEYFLDGGFAWFPTRNLQFDVRVGVGLNDAAVDYFVGVGGAIRYY
jgi:hypothetical protein